MSHLIPPLVSNSPPPILTGGSDDLDDEFGDFAVPGDINLDGYSLPSSPMHIPNPFNPSLSIPECPDNKDLQNGIAERIHGDEEVPKVQNVETKRSECVNISAINVDSTICENDVGRNVDINDRIQDGDFGDFQKTDETFGDFGSFKDDENKTDFDQTNPKLDDFGDFKDHTVENNFEDHTSEIDIHKIKNNDFDDHTIIKNDFDDHTIIKNDFDDHTTEKNDRTIKDDDLGDHTMKNNEDRTTINDDFENRSMKNDVIEDRTIKDDRIEDYTIKNDGIEGRTIKNDLPEGQTIKNDDFESKTIKTDAFGTETIKNVDFKEDLTPNDIFKENTVTNDVSAEDNLMKRDVFKDDTIKSDVFTDDTVKPDEFKKGTIKSDVFKGDTIKSDVFKGDTMKSDVFKGDTTKTDVFDVDAMKNDDFGDFESVVEFDNTEAKQNFDEYKNGMMNSSFKSPLNGSKEILSEPFGDFDRVNVDNLNVCDSKVPDGDVPDLDLKYEEPDDDFGDFETSERPVSMITKDDFVECAEPVEFEANFNEAAEKDDDFGDFNDYSTQSTVNLGYTKTEILDYSDKTIKSIFKMEKVEFPEYEHEDVTENNPVFNRLKVIENTHALNFQWNNSEGQTMLLKSLNIDSRNILYGPRWNPTMPKFASNLGFQPLEPQKTDIVPSTSTPSESQPVEVPDAKFDWTSSGLVNPLDCSQDDMLLDLEQLVTSLDLAPTTSSSFLTATTTLAPPPIPAVNSPVDDYQTWDHWLQCQSNKEDNTEDKYKLPVSDILALQSEPTLPQSDNESVNSLKFAPTDIEIENQTEDDFTNFESYKTDDVSWSPINMQPLRETHISEPTEYTEEDEFADFQISLPQKSVFKPIPTVLKPPSTESLDPFKPTDKPIEETVSSIKPFEILKPLEPLKPVVLQPMVLPTAPAKIEWPEPGIVDETRISDLNYYPHKNTVDDDDWSDFVSVTKPQETFPSNRQLELSVPNLQNTQLSCKSLPQMQPAVSSPLHKPNSTPSTQQIAVQQLQSGYQPPYQIPLQPPHVNPIGIEGIEFEPALKPISSTNLDAFITSPKKPLPKPQSASLFQPLQSIENSFLKMPQSTFPSTTDNDDDDWSDFVSNQTVAPETPNGWNINKPQVRTIAGNVKPYCWSQDVQPNIITNPVHFDVFQSYQPGKDVKTTKKPTNNIPSISSNSILPELDFAAPKSKFFIKK